MGLIEKELKKCHSCKFWIGKPGQIGYCKKYRAFIWDKGNCIIVIKAKRGVKR